MKKLLLIVFAAAMLTADKPPKCDIAPDGTMVCWPPVERAVVRDIPGVPSCMPCSCADWPIPGCVPSTN